jgi:hypothetical protein
MRDLVTTNDPVLLSYVRALLEEAEVEFAVFDTNMSAVQGTLGALPQRLAVPEDSLARARRILEEAGLGQWIVRK